MVFLYEQLKYIVIFLREEKRLNDLIRLSYCLLDCVVKITSKRMLIIRFIFNRTLRLFKIKSRAKLGF